MPHDISSNSKSNASTDCLFCKLSKNNDNIIYETERLYVLLDRFPSSDKHLLLILKEHHQLFHEYDDDSLKELIVLAKSLAIKFKMESYNLVQNNINEQMIKHTHLHLIGSNDSGRFETKNTPKMKLNDEEYSELAKSLKSKLNL